MQNCGSESLPEPVKIRFSNLTASQQRRKRAFNSGIQCSIVTSKPGKMGMLRIVTISEWSKWMPSVVGLHFCGLQNGREVEARLSFLDAMPAVPGSNSLIADHFIYYGKSNMLCFWNIDKLLPRYLICLQVLECLLYGAFKILSSVSRQRQLW